MDETVLARLVQTDAMKRADKKRLSLLNCLIAGLSRRTRAICHGGSRRVAGTGL